MIKPISLRISFVLLLLSSSISTYAYDEQHLTKLLTTRICQQCDLSDVNLTEHDLKGLDVSHSNLSDANFRSCDLSGGNFKNSNLTRAKFENAMIENSSFEEANLSWTRFDMANLKNSNFFKATMKETNLSGADLRMADLKGAIFLGVRINLTYLVEAIWHDGIRCKFGSIGKCVK